MAVLWCGGEDIDFPNGASLNVNASSGFRTGYARCGINPGTVYPSLSKSTLFQGGPITTGWLSFQVSPFSANSTAYPAAASPQMLAGFGSSATGAAIGLSVANSGTNSSLNVSLCTFNGTSSTTVATTSQLMLAQTYRVDLQLVSYGATGTLTLYINGAQWATFTGNIAISGTTGFDSVFLASTKTAGASTQIPYFSEIIVADEPTLGWQGLVTANPTGNGATQSWSNAGFANVNPTTINDANSTFTNTTAQDTEYTLQGIPAGNFNIKAVKVVARASATPGATSTNIELGFNNTNTSVVAVGAAQAVGTSFAPIEKYFATDPTSSGGTSPWGANLTGYQLNLRSA